MGVNKIMLCTENYLNKTGLNKWKRVSTSEDFPLLPTPPGDRSEGVAQTTKKGSEKTYHKEIRCI